MENTDYISTTKDFYRVQRNRLFTEGCNLPDEDYFLTEGIYSGESVSVNNAFYGDSCDYVYSDWN